MRIMQIPIYIKGALLLIVLFLGVIAFRMVLSGESVFAQSAAKLNTQVLCSSCDINIPEHKTHGHIIILDQNTGKVWAYEQLNETPFFLGTMSEVGKPLQALKQ